MRFWLPLLTGEEDDELEGAGEEGEGPMRVLLEQEAQVKKWNYDPRSSNQRMNSFYA